jgi:hypothetical protein
MHVSAALSSPRDTWRPHRQVDRLTDDVKGVKGQLNGAIKRMETAAAAVLMSTGMAGTTKRAQVEAPRATQYMPEQSAPEYAGYPSLSDPSVYAPPVGLPSAYMPTSNLHIAHTNSYNSSSTNGHDW